MLNMNGQMKNMMMLYLVLYTCLYMAAEPKFILSLRGSLMVRYGMMVDMNLVLSLLRRMMVADTLLLHGGLRT